MTADCVVPGCGATRADFGTFLFKLPIDEVSSHRGWINTVRTSPNTEEAFICWSHFEGKDLLREGTTFRRKPEATPSRFLGGELKAAGLDSSFCRFCATELSDDARENCLIDMNQSVDSKNLLDFLMPNGIDERLSAVACDECFLQAKLVVRFIRDCKRATRELEQIADTRSRSHGKIQLKCEVKAEMDEFGEIPIGSVQEEVKMEVSSLGGFSDRASDSSDDEDDLPLARRIKNEATEKIFKCEHCSFSCLKSIQLNSHMKKHRALLAELAEPKPEGPLKCAHCDFSCSKPIQLASHKKKHRDLYAKPEKPEKETKPPVEQPTEFHCPECPYTCKRANQMASHKKKHSTKRVKKEPAETSARKVGDMYQCEFCDFQCKFRRQMAGHRASHSNMIKKSKPSGKERDHMCSICGKILSTRGSFFVHMKYHNDQRDYSCEHCDKKFYSKRDVVMHVESFHEKKKFECEICGVKCGWKNALYKHMRKHDASAFKHECSYCGKKFIAANELRLHVWRHTGQQLSCDICGAGYRFNFLLTQHKIREHGIQIEGVKLYKRFQKGKGDSGGGGAGPRKRVQQIDPSKCIPATTVHRPVEHAQDERHHEDLSSSSYSGDLSGQYSQQHDGQQLGPLATAVPHLPFHPLGVLGGQPPMLPGQAGPFDQVGNF